MVFKKDIRCVYCVDVDKWIADDLVQKSAQ